MNIAEAMQENNQSKEKKLSENSFITSDFGPCCVEGCSNRRQAEKREMCFSCWINGNDEDEVLDEHS